MAVMHDFQLGEIVWGPFVKADDPEWEGSIPYPPDDLAKPGEYRYGRGKIVSLENNGNDQYISVAIIEGSRASGGYRPSSLCRFIPGGACPRCEQRPKLEGDYLCQECRYGC